MNDYSKCVILMISILLCAAPQAMGQQASAAEIIEKRGVPPPSPVGTRQPEVGWEMAAPLEWPTIHKTKDGRLMMIGEGKVCYSQDNGKTWSKPETLLVRIDYAIRLHSGKLGGPGPVPEGQPVSPIIQAGVLYFYVSADEGKTWERRGRIQAPDAPGAGPYSNTMIQTKSGRLILPVRWCDGAGHMGLYEATRAWGVLNGKLMPVEGHAHFPEPDNAFVLYSDDEGQTWKRSEGGIMIWHKEGYGGMWPCDEPSVIEARNGDIFMFCRTTLGRLYTVHSGAQSGPAASGAAFIQDTEKKRKQFTPGERFDFPQSTILAASYSPCAIRRVPKTGDWLVVWNQVSGDEIRGSYRRGRLSSAISKDDGKTWVHFRTIDTVVLPPAGRVEPDPEPQMARGFDFVGVLPEDYGSVDYPTLEIVDDSVFLAWYRALVKPRPADITGRRLRVVPLSWFYQDEPPPPLSPKLIIRVPPEGGKGWNTYTIPARYHEGRFYCHLEDVARYLKGSVGRLGLDMYAPVDQVITCLGWTASYDHSHLRDAQDPREIVTVVPPYLPVPESK